jgi:hypothetical protein
MTKDISQLIQWIVWYASSCELNLTRLRLVKFLYLTDLFFAREKNGQTLTKFPWAFVHYGPYCSEAVSEIDAAVSLGLIEEQAYQSKYEDKDYYLYRSLVEEEPFLLSDLPTYVSSELKWAIQKWGEDSGGLLDYVYFETEPMINVHRGDFLDFSKARKPIKQPKIQMKKLSKKQLNIAKEAIKKLSEKTLANERARNYQYTSTLYDEKYLVFLNSLEESDVETGLDGVAEIKN